MDIALPGADFWLFDSKIIRFNIFTGDGNWADDMDSSTTSVPHATCPLGHQHAQHWLRLRGQVGAEEAKERGLLRIMTFAELVGAVKEVL